MSIDWKSFEVHGKNMNIKSSSGEVSDGNEEDVIGNWRKGNLCHKVIMNLAGLYLCSSVLCKVEFASEENGYLAEEMSKQTMQSGVLFHLTAYSKM